METEKKRPGRKPGKQVVENPAKQRSMRFNDLDWAALGILGGAAWVRAQIPDEVREQAKKNLK